MNIRTLTVALAGAALFGLTAALVHAQNSGFLGVDIATLLLPMCYPRRSLAARMSRNPLERWWALEGLNL